MIDLTERSLPNTLEVNGRLYSIYTDFRVWIRFENELRDHQGGDLPVGYLFKNEMPARCSVRDLLAFARPPQELPRAVRGTATDAITLDYRIDGDLIYAAFLQQYGIDLVDIEELHWHKFLALLRGLKGTKLDEVIGYRCYERQTDRHIDPYEEMRDAWEIYKYDPEDDEVLEEFNRQLGGE